MWRKCSKKHFYIFLLQAQPRAKSGDCSEHMQLQPPTAEPCARPKLADGDGEGEGVNRCWFDGPEVDFLGRRFRCNGETMDLHLCRCLN